MHDKVISQTRTRFTEAYAQSLSANCNIDLLPSDMFLFATYHLVIIIICAKLHSRELKTLHLKSGIQGFHNKIMALNFIFKGYIYYKASIYVVFLSEILKSDL